MEAVGRSLTDAVRKMLRMPNVDERAIKELVKDLQRTLLQADVNVELVLQLSKAVEERSIKEKLPPGINRREHVVKVLYEEPGKKKPEDIAKHGLEHFKKENSDLVIIDTAGRHRNEKDLMDEMKRIASAVKPDEIVLAIDATIGQQAIHQAKAFHEATPIGSVLLTKMDGSAKGGGALSAVVATGSKVKFIGSGERVEDLELFVPTDFA